MKIMVLGSISGEDRGGFKRLCANIGLVLARMNATLVICSLFEDSADYYVYEEFVQKSLKTEVHYFDNKDVRKQIRKVVKDNRIVKIPYLDDKTQLDTRDAYLFCQINAIKNVDGIIAIGGKINGSANLLLHIAEANKKLVIPFIKYKGAAEDYFNRNKYLIKDLLGNNFSILYGDDEEAIIKSFIEKREKVCIDSKNVGRVFLSYARENPTWADCAEIILMRRGIPVFRDESEFKAGSDIPRVIREEIYRANTFIAMWCKEYACSPWCIDEMEMALERREDINFWIVCVDNTRIVPKAARNLLYYKVECREDLERVLLKLLMSLK